MGNFIKEIERLEDEGFKVIGGMFGPAPDGNGWMCILRMRDNKDPDKTVQRQWNFGTEEWIPSTIPTTITQVSTRWPIIPQLTDRWPWGI
jgi:hypothetical protein